MQDISTLIVTVTEAKFIIQQKNVTLQWLKRNKINNLKKQHKHQQYYVSFNIKKTFQLSGRSFILQHKFRQQQL